MVYKLDEEADPGNCQEVSHEFQSTQIFFPHLITVSLDGQK